MLPNCQFDQDGAPNFRLSWSPVGLKFIVKSVMIERREAAHCNGAVLSSVTPG